MGSEEKNKEKDFTGILDSKSRRRIGMDIATMVAINNLNMMTMMQAMQQRQNVITILSNGKEELDYGRFYVRSVYGKKLYSKSF